MKKIILITMMIISASIKAEEVKLKKTYTCGSTKSILVNVLEGLRNTTRFRGNRGYYTSGIRFEIMQTQEGTYNYELLGEQAFCKKGEQCAGLYAIAEGKTKVLFNGEVITNDYNPLIKFSIDTITRECEVEILDFRVKKKLTKFKGELYE